METETVERDAMGESFTDVERLINETVWKFMGSYGGEFQELQAHAFYLYCRAYLSYRKDKARLTTWVRFKVWKGLLDEVRKERKIERRMKSLDGVEVPINCPFDERRFRWDLSEGASEAVEDLLSLAEQNPRQRISQIDLIQSLQKKGWGQEKIRKVFQEVRKAL